MRSAVALVALLAVGCLRDNDEFVEPAPVYGDCTIHPDACQEDLVCLEVTDRRDDGSAFVCSDFSCDEPEDCPEGSDGNARRACRADNVCTLECTPIPCMTMGSCTRCPEGHRCAMNCGMGDTPEESTHCVACPTGMDCIPYGGSSGSPQFQCAYLPD